ncbi:orotidine 5'-phosphate decarboxylase [Hyphomonas polymorpha PS728]|uniref:Orotidine 5'-phosphate decarboxylase n=1 Tax=Hyphomonas polymorpha PS728 TaxID=1280954 RepID=A0A062VK65_9PROT|nr:orotidine-5'-phosphate decarboxylase [Hyphomonas polymorpha]KCZ98495.1 orotidine 5'-phosphate decarboxylase [Hyphomonas polymorpha PS728]
MTDFASRLIDGTRKFGPLCVGIDPHPGMIPELFGGDTPEGVRKWSQAIIEAAAGKVAVVKPQVSLFERHGPEGMAALQAAAKAARAAGLIVLMDAKRGDIGSTAEGYAQAYLAPGAPFEGDGLTVNPYMGLDTLEPYAKLAKAHGKGVIVLVRTSNPGAADFQSRIMGGAPLYVRVAEALQPLTERLMSPCGWSSLMMVIGATAPEEARAVRALAPKALFLVPGYGAQGAGAAEACSGLVNGEGGVVSASRSVTFPKAAANAGDMAGWRRAVEEAILAARDELRLAAVA